MRADGRRDARRGDLGRAASRRVGRRLGRRRRPVRSRQGGRGGGHSGHIPASEAPRSSTRPRYPTKARSHAARCEHPSLDWRSGRRRSPTHFVSARSPRAARRAAELGHRQRTRLATTAGRPRRRPRRGARSRRAGSSPAGRARRRPCSAARAAPGERGAVRGDDDFVRAKNDACAANGMRSRTATSPSASRSTPTTRRVEARCTAPTARGRALPDGAGGSLAPSARASPSLANHANARARDARARAAARAEADERAPGRSSASSRPDPAAHLGDEPRGPRREPQPALEQHRALA